MTEKVFKVEFGCSNCGNVWEEEFEEGTKITSDYYSKYSIKVRCSEADLSHVTTQCDICRTIKCTVCSLPEEVTINNRNPL